MEISRRNFLVKSSLLAAGFSVGVNNILQAKQDNINELKETLLPNFKDKESFNFSVFSKTLQWLDCNEMAKFVAEIGFDGIDLTVRPNGHVLPENVEQDLPKAVEAAKKAGISIFMIVTSINDADDPIAERILKTASALGIKHYRMDWLYYDESKTIDENLAIIQTKMSKLALLNEKYKIRGEYQNHSGKYTPNSYFGSAIWDLHSVLKSINSPWIGSQYDIMHSTVEGAFSWETNLKLMSPYIQTLAMKDFYWLKKQDKWVPEVTTIGSGMIDFNYYFELLKKYKISCPVTMHYEYPLGDLEKGDKTLTKVKREEVITLMKNDLIYLKNLFRQKGMIQ